MTYKLWVNGAEQGPYTRDEIQGQYERGELVGVLWRRVGQSRFLPHTDLEAELAETAPPAPNMVPVKVREREPGGDSFLGQLAIVIGFLMFVLGFVGGLADVAAGRSSGPGLADAGMVFMVVGFLAQIHAKLRIIAHRLRRE